MFVLYVPGVPAALVYCKDCEKTTKWNKTHMQYKKGAVLPAHLPDGGFQYVLSLQKKRQNWNAVLSTKQRKIYIKNILLRGKQGKG